MKFYVVVILWWLFCGGIFTPSLKLLFRDVFENDVKCGSISFHKQRGQIAKDQHLGIAPFKEGMVVFLLLALFLNMCFIN